MESMEPKTEGGKLKARLTPEDMDALYGRLVGKSDAIETMLIYEGRPLWEVAESLGVRYRVLLSILEDEKRAELHSIWADYKEKIRRVSDSLYKSAIGSYAEEEQAFKIRVVTDYVNKKGQKCRKTEERIEKVTVRRYLPPNFNSIQFFLTNRDPKEWKTEIKLANSTGESQAKEPIRVLFKDPKTQDNIDRINAIEEKIK